ncbi:MAG TPA: hypothetical protein DCR44_00330 [Acholeplasmatales bacterium]|nr:MAG: hypothetical protein A2Y16_05760 [Tenericutes bacterium GWF2_57_13]HAQ55849.1 hypothetical protein [Acholeplasmatales bacterium]
MKRLLKGFILLTTIGMLFGTFRMARVSAENTVVLHFFHVESCINCAAEEVALTEIATRYDNLTIVKYEVNDPASAALFESVKTAFGDVSGTPYTVIGGVAFSGYNDQTKRDIETMIVRYSDEDHADIVAMIQDGITPQPSDFDTFGYDEGDVIRLPLIGEIPIENLSLGLAAVVIGFVDGFNPCAMWVLLFLIALLADMGNRKRMWILGGTFLFASGAMYYLFMAAWLNVALSVAEVVWIRVVIGVIAFLFGVRNVYKFFKKAKQADPGCDVTDAKQKKKIADRVREIVRSGSFWFALGGIVLLAVSVNFVELACSAGLPLLYTQLLAYHDLASGAYYGFIGLYVLFFLLDDLFVFAVAMITMKVTGVSARYAKWSMLVGGLIMAVLGVLLVFFPEIATLRF